ncbi:MULTISPECIES: hypothetical protein [unclassified Sphingobium]|uniref:hypothetical protein n=1 Tax=unclassified Sphingobium TaxID=2611147 RepID=UPI001EEF8E8B|nr:MULTISPECIES: hypothetical protein [unclassified Sphingobium]
MEVDRALGRERQHRFGQDVEIGDTEEIVEGSDVGAVNMACGRDPRNIFFLCPVGYGFPFRDNGNDIMTAIEKNMSAFDENLLITDEDASPWLRYCMHDRLRPCFRKG